MAPEVDPVLTDTQNWDSHSHRALYESVHINNDPGQSGEIGSEWAQFATELADSAQIITHRIVSTETGWTGDAADGARTAIKKLSDWISGTAQTAGQVGDRVADQGQVMQDARAAMPEPVEFTWTGATGAMVGGGISSLLASTADVQAANAKSQAAKELAVTVMSNMEASSRAIDQSTPVFTAPFNPTTGRTEEPQLVAMRSVQAPMAGGAVDGLQAIGVLQSRGQAVEMGVLQEGVAAERTTAAAAAFAPPLVPTTSFDGGGYGGAGGGAGSGGYTGGAGAGGGYTGGAGAGGGYAGGAGAGGGYTGGAGAGGGYAGGGSYTGGAYKSSPSGGYSDDESDELGSTYRQGGTTTAAEAAASVPVANVYTPPAAGGFGGAGGYSDTTNYNGAGGVGGLSGNTGRGSSPSRSTAPASAGNPAGYLGAPGTRPPGVPIEGVGVAGSTGRSAGGYGGAGSYGGGGGGGAGGFGGGAGGGSFDGSAAGAGGVGGSGTAGAGGSTGVMQPGSGQTPTGGANPGGAMGASGMAGAPMGGAPMGGAGGRSEEDKEHKSASYIMGGDLFDMPGENLPPSVIGGVKPKKKSGEQA